MDAPEAQGILLLGSMPCPLHFLASVLSWVRLGQQPYSPQGSPFYLIQLAPDLGFPAFHWLLLPSFICFPLLSVPLVLILCTFPQPLSSSPFLPLSPPAFPPHLFCCFFSFVTFIPLSFSCVSILLPTCPQQLSCLILNDVLSHATHPPADYNQL